MFYFRTILKGWGEVLLNIISNKTTTMTKKHLSFVALKKTKLTMKNTVGAVIYKISDFISPCSYTKQGS